MKYLVTGGAGFIGSHLCEYLSKKNHDIVAIDDFSTGSIANIEHLKKINLINKRVQNVEIYDLGNIDGIFHLAAQASVPVSINDFYESSTNNILSSIQVFDWAKKLSVPIIYASSSAIYGNLSKGDDRKEDCEILSPYAQDKLTLEHYAKMCWNVYKTPSIGWRFFNVYGPRQDPKNPYSGVISIFIDRLLQNKSVTVNGGYQTRDFIYVKDIVKTLLCSMEFILHNNFCDSINLGTGKSITINNLLEIIASILNVNPQKNVKELPDGDPEISSGTYNKIKEVLNIDISTFQGLDDGLFETIKYIKKDLLS